MVFGKSNMIDYDLLATIIGGANSSYKPIPKGSSTSITIPAGTAVGTEFNAQVLPDDGYVMALSYIILDVPSGIEANVIVDTDEGSTALLANNATTGTQIDASDFLGLGGLKKVTLYAKVTGTLTTDVTVTMEYAGRQIKT